MTASPKYTKTTPTTPDGGDGFKITCHCGAHRDGKDSAIIAERMGARLTYTVVHSLVGVANGPTARVASVKANGPWAA